ncbi:MAG: hypothetical protein RJA20_211 [Bacteroidota bacterium]|jgi:glyoxylase-like metal-dependent hydrolase (beta-lactamase superfamily II)/rhodanese-related sulfurtransferase
MKVEQIYTGCLAHGAYYIESDGEVAIIDPLREVTPYLERASKDNARIRYILETHFHADFVSGHLDLAAKTGATIVYGPTARPNFKAHVAEDGEFLQLGRVKIKVLHTPGHTMESSCFLLLDETGKETGLFSGDTLFIGDVGRPDLAQKAASMTQEELAATLYDSLRNKVMPLAGDTMVYPGHGAGSACGKKMSKETTDTLGNQKKNNYALRADMSREEFVQEVLTGLTPPPGYFPQNVMMNKMGYDSIDTVIKRGHRALSPRAFEAAANETDALILDTRKADVFASGFVPNSVNIAIDGSFAPWAGVMIPDVKQEILIVAEPGREEEVITRLARVGYDYCIGYLDGGFEAWKAAGMETDEITQVSANDLAAMISSGHEINLLDVRKKSEYDSEHVLIAENTPLDYLNESMKVINPDKTYHVHCAAGYRSMVFVSALRARGYRNLIDVAGGMDAIKKSGRFQLSEYVCPTTLL